MPRISSQYEQAQREHIIEGAAQVFADNGYRATTVDQICQQLKLSKGAIYIYFNSKEDLFISAMRNYNQRRINSLITAFEPDAPIMLKLEKLLERFSNLLARDDYVYARLWIESFLESNRIPALAGIKSEAHQQSFRLIYGLLEEGQRSGELNQHLDIKSLTTVTIATLDGLMLHSFVPDRGIDPQLIREIVWETFLPLLVPKQ